MLKLKYFFLFLFFSLGIYSTAQTNDPIDSTGFYSKAAFLQSLNFYQHPYINQFIIGFQLKSFDELASLENDLGLPLGLLFTEYLEKAQLPLQQKLESIQNIDGQGTNSTNILKLLTYVSSRTGKSDEAFERLKSTTLNQTINQDKNLIFSIITELIRLANDTRQVEKAMLFSSVTLHEDQHLLPKYLYFDRVTEQARFLILSGQPDVAIKILASDIDQILKDRNHHTFEILKLNILTDVESNNQDIKPMLIQRLEENLDSVSNIKIKELAKTYLGHYYSDKNTSLSLKYFREAWDLHESFNKKINEYILYQLGNGGNSYQKIVPKKPVRVFGTFWIVVILVFFGFQSLLLIWLFMKYRHFTKVIREKTSSIAATQTENKQSMQDSFENIDSLVLERENNLRKELIERSRIDNELKEALNQAEEANYQKNAFLSNISHEIRTPLNGIIGFSNLLENELAMLDQPDLFDYANSIQRSGEKLLHLLNNIIDISRLEANDIEFKMVSCDLTAIIQSVVQFYKSAASEKGLKIVHEVAPIQVMADTEMLARVLHEIIDNAIKYTEKGFIRINVEKDLKNGMVKIAIRDTGIGIDEQYIPDLFEAYRHESHGYSRQYQGAALGIPLSRQLIERMGGIFSLNSRKAIGTTVTITLPESKTQQIITNKAMTDVAELAAQVSSLLMGKKVLVVEDDAASRKIILRFLEKFATINGAADGEMALQMIQNELNEPYHLLIFDINLPAPWNGMELLKEIRNKYSHYQSVPAIAQTAYAMFGDQDGILESGFNAYMAKPVQKSVLYQHIIQMMV